MPTRSARSLRVSLLLSTGWEGLALKANAATTAEQARQSSRDQPRSTTLCRLCGSGNGVCWLPPTLAAAHYTGSRTMLYLAPGTEPVVCLMLS